MKTLKVAVVGAGFWGRNHVRVLSELPNVNLVAVCDVDRWKADEVAGKYGLKSYDNSREMYEKEEIDAVTICVWSSKLAEETQKALKYGKHVLVEKPMAHTVREAQKILKIAESENLKLSVGFIERFNPGVKRVKEAIQDGFIGIPVLATARRVSRWPQRIGDVGVIKDTAIHDIDIIRFIFGEDPISVYARVGRLQHERFEDYAQIMLTFPHDKAAFLEANWLTPYKIRRLIVTGSEAIISLDYITQEVTIETPKQTITPRHEWEEPLKIELSHFVDCVLNNREPMVSGIDGLKALKISEAALKSAAKGCAIKIKF